MAVNGSEVAQKRTCSPVRQDIILPSMRGSGSSLDTGNQLHKRCKENVNDQATDHFKSPSTTVADDIQTEERRGGKGWSAKEATKSKGWSAKEAKCSMRPQLQGNQGLQAAKPEMYDTYSKSRESARLVICAPLPVGAPLAVIFALDKTCAIS